MPPQSRLDGPAVLHHVMMRRIEERAIFRAVATANDLPPEALTGKGRPVSAAQGRREAAHVWCRLAGQPGRILAAAPGTTPQAVYAGARRGGQTAPIEPLVWRSCDDWHWGPLFTS